MFYFFMIVIAFYNFLLYAIFRSGIYSYLRLLKMSKTYIKKNRKGFINYWLYYSINKQNSLGILYGLNLAFFIVTLAFMLSTITVGYIRTLQPILFAFSIVVCVIEIPCMIIASIHSNNEDYGKPFIFLAKRKHWRGYTSSLIDWSSWTITAFLIYLSFQQLWLYTFLLFSPTFIHLSTALFLLGRTEERFINL